MIVVSHRGPYRFEANGDGSYSSSRGAGGVATALSAVGAEGVVSGVTALECSEAGPDPAALAAVTVNV